MEFVPTAGSTTAATQNTAGGSVEQPVNTGGGTSAVPADLLQRILAGLDNPQRKEAPVNPNQQVQQQGTQQARAVATTPTPGVDLGQTTTPAHITPSVSSGDALMDSYVKSVVDTYKIDSALYAQAVEPALVSGNPADLNVLAIAAKLGAPAAQAAQQMFQAVQQHVVAKNARITNTIYAEAGGADQWRQAVGYFNQSTPDGVKQHVKAMLESGDDASVRYGVQQVLQAARTAGIGATAQVPFGTTAGTNTGLSAAEFATAYRALSQKAGNRSLESGALGQEYQALMAARALGKRLGK